MAAFDQRRTAKALVDFPRRSAHFFNGRSPGQNFRFVQIWRGERRQRQKFSLSIFIAAGSSNFAPLVETMTGINHELRKCELRIADLRIAYAGKNSDHTEFSAKTTFRFSPPPAAIPRTRPPFVAAASRANTVRFPKRAGILRGEAGDGARAVDAERGERFQIGLDARAAAAVRAGDGQCYRN